MGGSEKEKSPQTVNEVRVKNRRYPTNNQQTKWTPSRVQSLSRFKDQLDGSDDFGSDADLILTPPKAKRLVDSIICDVVTGEKSPYSFSDTSPLTFKNNFLEKDDDEQFSDCDFHSIRSESIRGQSRQDLQEEPEVSNHGPRKTNLLEQTGGRSRQDARIEKLESQISRLAEEINKRDDDIADLREAQKTKDLRKKVRIVER